VLAWVRSGPPTGHDADVLPAGSTESTHGDALASERSHPTPGCPRGRRRPAGRHRTGRPRGAGGPGRRRAPGRPARPRRRPRRQRAGVGTAVAGVGPVVRGEATAVHPVRRARTSPKRGEPSRADGVTDGSASGPAACRSQPPVGSNPAAGARGGASLRVADGTTGDRGGTPPRGRVDDRPRSRSRPEGRGWPHQGSPASPQMSPRREATTTVSTRLRVCSFSWALRT
jgi:hypothetical protein